MLAATWSLRLDGHSLDSYNEYRNHPTVFTLKINHGGTLTSPPNVRYRGGKANWFDDVDLDTFSAIEVQTMPVKNNNTYKDRPGGSNTGKSPSGSNAGKRPSVIEDVDGSDSSAANEDSEDSDNSEFDVGDEDRIENVERKRALKKLAKAHRPVDGQMYTENFYVGQSLANKQLIKEMVSKLSVAQRRQLWFTRNDKTRMRAECRGLVPVFGNGPGDSGLGVGDGGPVCDKPKVDSRCDKKTKKKDPVGDSIKCPWLLHCSKSKKAETWWVKKFNDSHTCLQSRSIGKCTASFLSKEIEETIKPNPRVPISALKDQLATGNMNWLVKEISWNGDAAQYKVIWNGGDLYDTTGPHGDKCVVNITLRSCACRKWEITGMPCKHAVACIWDMANNGLEPGIPESWVHESYWLKTWEEMYRFKINPCNGPDMWPESDTPITLTPPNYKPPVGRPRKKRRKSAAEIYDNLVKKGKLSRAGKTVTCLKCGQQGHNKRSCKGQRQKGSASGSHAPPRAPSQTTTHASTQASQSSTQPSQAP
ncbi:transposase, MuDR [Tanacetum coccineum]|uniref:Transposase, MuDR n=1 Tax=Tanacetum coccineum TaxID=301880 RepID=A0ABQ4YN30_9ASTR